MVYGFAKQSGGPLRMTSEAGEGLTLRIHLPRHRGTTVGEAAGRVDGSTNPDPRLPGRHGMRGDGGQRRRGWPQVVSIRHAHRIDLSVKDVGVPGGMNGRQVAETARGRRPGLKIPFDTGDAKASLVERRKTPPGMDVQTKPFSVEAMVAHVQEMTNARWAGCRRSVRTVGSQTRRNARCRSASAHKT